MAIQKYPFIHSQIGDFIPPNDKHGVSVSLPTWEATVGWASRDPAVVDVMRTGYPRFFIHRLIEELGARIVERVSENDISSLTSASVDAKQKRRAIFFPVAPAAEQCQRFLQNSLSEVDSHNVTLLQLARKEEAQHQRPERADVRWDLLELHAVIYPADMYLLAKSFWQHTGFGISSRYAERCLKCFNEMYVKVSRSSEQELLPKQADPNGTKNGLHESAKMDDKSQQNVDECEDQTSKHILRRRIANIASNPQITVQEHDVYLYPSGMCGITNTAQALNMIHPTDENCHVVCYGFLYVDTFKTISKVLSLHTTLYGHCSSIELDELEHRLETGWRISGLFLEVPGNPLLLSPDLPRIRSLADKYGFLVICDDTIATSVNVDVLPWVDVICTSLTKMFSGACNTMGGSVVINPSSRHYAAMHQALSNLFLDTYYPLDAAIMELNSQDFVQRVQQATSNAELVCDILRQDELVTQVYFPKGSPTQHHYDVYRRPNGGYGFLLSIIFVNHTCAVAFFNALQVAKGPSLGTNFSLSCPYTLFAHYKEREWAAEYGLKEDLIRISIGVESSTDISDRIRSALDIARNSGNLMKPI